MRKVCHAVVILLGIVTVAEARQGAITGVTLSPITAEVGATVTATVTGTTGACGGVHLNWGEGEPVTHATSYLPVTKTHVYATAGTFTVRAQGMGNCVGEATARIVVKAPPPPPPTAPAPRLTAITLPPAIEPGAAAAIRVEGSGACRVTLDFGDGTNLELDATLPATVKHAYPKAGRYTVTATPAAPCTERRSATLEVGRTLGGRISGIQVRPRTTRAGEAVTITVNGTGTCNVFLDFDDGKDRRIRTKLPYAFPYTFAEPRNHEIIVWTDEPCTGSAESIVRVRRR